MREIMHSTTYKCMWSVKKLQKLLCKLVSKKNMQWTANFSACTVASSFHVPREKRRWWMEKITVHAQYH